jgi:AraC-like DNA-binding protein
MEPMPRPDAASDFVPVRFSTRDLPERERLPRWREEFGRGIVRADIEPVSRHLPFHAEATLQALPGVRTVCCAGSAVRFERSRAMVDGAGAIGLVVNLGPEAIVCQRGREIRLNTGDAFPILDEAATLTNTSHLGILLPYTALAARISNLDGAAMRVIPRGTEPLRLLVTYLRFVCREAALAMPELRQSVVSHLHDLAALALRGDSDTSDRLSAAGAARLAVALADIAAGFTEPGLTVEAVARRQGVTPRYLQQLLEMSGTSFTARVNELRLQRAFALLSAVQGRRRRIADIAMEAGFSDVSHFNRLFRARFGATPSGVRRH